MKTKLKKKKCWEERKERKEGKNRYAKLNRTRLRFIYLKINCKGKIPVGKANKGISVEKYNKFKKLKFKVKKYKWKKYRTKTKKKYSNEAVFQHLKVKNFKTD